MSHSYIYIYISSLHIYGHLQFYWSWCKRIYASWQGRLHHVIVRTKWSFWKCADANIPSSEFHSFILSVFFMKMLPLIHLPITFDKKNLILILKSFDLRKWRRPFKQKTASVQLCIFSWHTQHSLNCSDGKPCPYNKRMGIQWHCQHCPTLHGHPTIAAIEVGSMGTNKPGKHHWNIDQRYLLTAPGAGITILCVLPRHSWSPGWYQLL